ncbi:MAG: hypothetical protein KC496_22925, partial [Anaerolineae bacterium]|nr:hypothetical protein [Anaerolineae bacterium]
MYTTDMTTPVLLVNLNHKSGTVAYDSSGNGNHGTLMGGAAFVVDNTLPPEADKLNLEGYTMGTGANGAAAGVLIPPDASNPGYDVLGNALDWEGSVYPVRPVKRESYCAVFDGVDDRLDVPNILVRFNAVIEMLVKIDYQSGQTTNIISNEHASNNSTGYAPRLNLDHTTGELRWYGNRGAPFPHWTVDADFFGQWHHLKFEFNSITVAYLTIDGGERVAIDSSGTNTGDYGYTRNTYWAFGKGKNMQVEWIKIETPSEGDAQLVCAAGYGTTVHDVSGNGNHGTIYGATTSPQGAGFWAGRQDEYHYNLDNGFSLSGDVRIPALADGSGLDAYTGAPLTNPPTATLDSNGAETKLDIRN